MKDQVKNICDTCGAAYHSKWPRYKHSCAENLQAEDRGRMLVAYNLTSPQGER